MKPTVLRSVAFLITFAAGVVLSALAFYFLSTNGEVGPISIQINERGEPVVTIVDTTSDRLFA